MPQRKLKNTGSKKILYPHQIWQLYLGESMIIVKTAHVFESTVKPQNKGFDGNKQFYFQMS